MSTSGSGSSMGQGVSSKTSASSPLWKYVTVVEALQGGGCFVWICSECNGKYKSSYSRVKAHLCAIPSAGIGACLGPSIGGKPGKGLARSKILQYIQEQEDAEAKFTQKAKHPLTKRGSSSRSSRPPVAPSAVTTPAHPFIASRLVATEDDSPESRKRTKSPGPLEKAFQNDARDIAEQNIARCVYACGLSFNVVRSPYWREMVKSINEAPKGFIGPGYEKVRTTLLTKERKHVEDALQPIRDSWVETGVTIVSDGWKDTANRPLINVVAVCPKGAMFLRAVDCEGQVKDAHFIANILIESIEAVGPHNIVQVVTDNAKNCKAAGMLVEARYGHIFWTPCAVHSLNLMLQKIGTKIDWIKQVYEEASEIQMFISNHHMSQGIFRSFSKLQLLKVAETRFASHTLVLRRLVKVREALSSMVINHLWSVWRQSNSEKAAKVKGLILDDGWWDRVDYLLSFTEPILSMLRFVDMDNPCMGEVYDGIDSMIETIKSIINAKEQDPSEKFFKEVHSILVERWNKMTTPLHLLAFALNPKYYSAEILSLPRRVLPYRDIEVSEGYKAAFSRLFPDPEEEDMVMGEFGLFMTSTGHSLGAMRDKYKKDAHMWWCLHGQAYTQLQPLAIKILSQVASSSSAERNWGTYTFIHSVKRNKLAAKKAEDLVYVHSNLRLLTHKLDEYKHGSTMFWDNDPETPDLDASIAHIALRDTDVACSSHDQHSGASGSGTAMSAAACDSNELHDDDNENIEEEYDYNEEEE